MKKKLFVQFRKILYNDTKQFYVVLIIIHLLHFHFLLSKEQTFRINLIVLKSDGISDLTLV